jgi:hypothetical protein
MIKEANKINMSFPELSLLSKVHKDAEEWMDRASIALRSRITLSELESLIEVGEKMPLGLTGALEKLQLRYKQACDWVSDLKKQVPCPIVNVSASACDLDACGLADWLLDMRNTLRNGDEETISELLDLCSQGSRLPVEVNLYHLLQIAVDARNWSSKAKRWIPGADSHFKRGKIEDLEDHLASADDISEKARKLTEKSDFQLEFLSDLQAIIERADAWFENVSANYCSTSFGLNFHTIS